MLARHPPRAESNSWTLPNAVTTLRILGSPVMIPLAANAQWGWLLGLAVALVITEWLDGYLARRWRQQSALGARLDTIADAIFYTAILLSIIAADESLITPEIWWIGAAMTSYLFSWMVSWIKFRRLPSYHTWSAKAVWFVVGPGIACLLLGRFPWVFRISMACVTLTNLEAILISWRLSKPRVDVPTLWHANPRKDKPRQRQI